jgi:hypothetical protein
MTEREQKRGFCGKNCSEPNMCSATRLKAQTKINEFMEERRSTLVLDVLFGQQLIVNAPVCCAEVQLLAYGKMRAGW